MFSLLNSVIEFLRVNRSLKYLAMGYLSHLQLSRSRLDPRVRSLLEKIIRSKPSLRMFTFTNLDRYQPSMHLFDFSDIGELSHSGGFEIYSKKKHEFPRAIQHGLESV